MGGEHSREWGGKREGCSSDRPCLREPGSSAVLAQEPSLVQNVNVDPGVLAGAGRGEVDFLQASACPSCGGHWGSSCGLRGWRPSRRLKTLQSSEEGRRGGAFMGLASDAGRSSAHRVTPKLEGPDRGAGQEEATRT